MSLVPFKDNGNCVLWSTLGFSVVIPLCIMGWGLGTYPPYCSDHYSWPLKAHSHTNTLNTAPLWRLGGAKEESLPEILRVSPSKERPTDRLCVWVYLWVCMCGCCPSVTTAFQCLVKEIVQTKTKPCCFQPSMLLFLPCNTNGDWFFFQNNLHASLFHITSAHSS